jgi:hypothetical protein
MSRVTTPPTAKPVAPTAQPASAVTTAKIPHERIAMRAYEKWVQHGRPQGTALQDWKEAEAELMKEVNRAGSTTTAPARPQR